MRKDARRDVNISPSEESLLKEDTTSQAFALQYDRGTQNVKQPLPGLTPVALRAPSVSPTNLLPPPPIKGIQIQNQSKLLLILSMVFIAGVMNYMVAAQQMLLGFYSIPTLFSASIWGIPFLSR